MEKETVCFGVDIERQRGREREGVTRERWRERVCMFQGEIKGQRIRY